MAVKERALLVLLISLFLMSNTAGIYFALTSRRSLQVWDLQPLWQAGRWIVEGRGSPYGDEMTRLLQIQSYGRLVGEGEDPHTFAYPLYALLLVLPLIFLPLPWAQAAWFTMLEFGVVVGVFGAIKLTGWRMSGWWVLLTVLWGFLLYPLAWALVLGQISILIFALFIATMLALQCGQEGWAGICMALTTAKPQMSFLLVPALLLWALARRRYRFLLSFAGTMGALLLISFLLLPGWLVGVLQAGISYFEAQPFPAPVMLLGETIAGDQGWAVALPLVVLLLARLTWAWWRERASSPAPLWPIGLTLVITTLIAPRTSVVNQAPLLLPLCLLLADLARRGRQGQLVAAMVQAVLLVGLWVIDLLCFPPSDSGEHWYAQQRVISPILPTFLLIALAMRPWWMQKGRAHL
jgi:hypothetical protein